MRQHLDAEVHGGATEVHRDGGHRRLAWVLAVLAVLVAGAVHGMVAYGASWPVWAEDEIGVIANARVLAGVDPSWTLAYLPYYPGTSVLLAPIWWLTSDPLVFYRVGIVVNAVVALVAIAPLSCVARRFGLATPWAIAVSAVVVAAPGRTVMSSFLLSENMLVLIVAITVVMAMRLFERPSPGRAALLATSAAFSFFTHGRALPVVIATVLCFVLLARRDPRTALVGAGTTIALTIAAYAAYRGIVGGTYAGTNREGVTGSQISAISFVGAFRALVGQLWYQVVAWFGLSILGVGVIVKTAARGLRRGRLESSAWAVLTIAGMIGMTTLILGAALSDPSSVGRLDYWAYGRYLDPFMIPFAVAGLATLGASSSWRTRGVAATIVLTVSLGMTFTLSLLDVSAPVAIINVAGLLPWQWVDTGLLTSRVVAAGAGVALIVVLVAGHRRAAVATTVVLAVAFCAGSIAVDRSTTQPLRAAWTTEESNELVATVALINPEDSPVAYDTDRVERGEENRAVFLLSPTRVVFFDSSAEDAPTEIVVGRRDWKAGAGSGARRAMAAQERDEAVWVMPGELQDRLDDAGLLERPDAAPALRDYDYTMKIQGEGKLTCSVSAAVCSLPVEITNRGRDVWMPLQAWSEDLLGDVRVVGWWTDGSSPLVAQLWELEESVAPGQTTSLTLNLDPPETLRGADLEVRLGLIQEGVGGFPGPTSGALGLVEVSIEP